MLFSLLMLLIGCEASESRNPQLSGGFEAQNETIKVAIQPFLGFKPAYLDTVRTKIESSYGFETVVYPPIKLPDAFFVNIKSPRYRADSIIRFLYTEKPDSIDIVIGLTHRDISTTKKDSQGMTKQPREKYSDWGIFGLGMIGRGSCVVSTFRLGKNAGESRKISRLKKITLHEIGHTLGLPHCPNQDCFMRDAAETIKTIDFVGDELCGNCRKRIGNGPQ